MGAFPNGRLQSRRIRDYCVVAMVKVSEALDEQATAQYAAGSNRLLARSLVGQYEVVKVVVRLPSIVTQSQIAGSMVHCDCFGGQAGPGQVSCRLVSAIRRRFGAYRVSGVFCTQSQSIQYLAHPAQ